MKQQALRLDATASTVPSYLTISCSSTASSTVYVVENPPPVPSVDGAAEGAASNATSDLSGETLESLSR
jgi:hypothetical protein